MNKALRNITLIASIPAAVAASALSDKIDQIQSYLTGKGISSVQNVNVSFDPDTNFTFPLGVEESDANLAAGLQYSIAEIDTLNNATKKNYVERNNGVFIVAGPNTDPDSVYRAITKSFSTGLEGLLRTDSRKISVSPLPANPNAYLSFNSEKQGMVEVYRTGIDGRTSKVFNGKLEMGRHALELNFNGLPSGMYLFTIKTPTYKTSVKVSLVR